MLQYLIVQLCDTSTSYCHYENPKRTSRLISLEDLNAGILFAMKENLMIQFVYPDDELPLSYKEAIDSIDHNIIVSSLCEDQNLVAEADIVIFHEWTGLDYYTFNLKQAYVLRTSKDDFFDRYAKLKLIFPRVSRFNIVFTDVESFSEEDYKRYKEILNHLSEKIEKLLVAGLPIRFNLLTDRLTLFTMNNCNAGWKTITLAPNGRFYACPAFYFDDDSPIGDVHKGLEIKNSRLYSFDYAPICRHCDAYQCKRCVWLNKKLTLEINTPSHEQCVISHLERNASRNILKNSNLRNVLKDLSEIPEIDYLDPFDVKDKWDYELLKQELIKFHKENY